MHPNSFQKQNMFMCAVRFIFFNFHNQPQKMKYQGLEIWYIFFDV
jgi:hypothetical protein